VTYRFYVTPDQIERTSAPGDEGVREFTAMLTGGEAQHAAQVLRLGAGDPVLIIDGSGDEYRGVVRRITSGPEGPKVEVWGDDVRPCASEPPVDIVLVQGLPKGDKLEEIVEKGTEVGVTHFMPVRTERTVVHYNREKAEKKRSRCERVALSAVKQSGRGRIPRVYPFSDLTDPSLRERLEGLTLIAFWEEAVTPLQHVAARLFKEGAEMPKGIALFIGPEGGFSQQEAKMLESWGAHIASLGPRILKTQTAGPVAAALVLYALGEGVR